MGQKYFSLERTGQSYQGKLSLPLELEDKWILLPERISNVDNLRKWLEEDELVNDKVIVVLCSIWAGLDIATLNYLIEKSQLSDEFKFFYRLHDEENFRMSFNPDGTNEMIHSPILFISSSKKLKSFSGAFDRDILFAV